MEAKRKTTKEFDPTAGESSKVEITTRRVSGRMRQMMKTQLCLYFGLVFGIQGVCHAAVIAVYEDSRYVDVPGSSAALQRILQSSGHLIQTFTDTTPDDEIVDIVAQDVSSAHLIVFPDLLNFGQLVNNLSGDSQNLLSGFVSSGGALISVGSSALTLLDSLFYPNQFASTGSGESSTLVGSVAIGTLFQEGPPVLGEPANSAMNPFAFSPPGSLNLYEDAAGGVTVFVAPFSVGQFGFLGWNFTPPAVDDNWNTVLNTMVSEFTAPFDEPTPVVSVEAQGKLATAWGRIKSGK